MNEEITDSSCKEFVVALASKSPVPGGGGASALVGAIGVALGNMVGSLTLGKQKYKDVQDEIISLKDRSDALQLRLLQLAEKDAQVFEPLAAAYSLPSETEEQRIHKADVMEVSLRECSEVPLDIMEACAEAITVIGDFAKIGSAIAVSDAGCAVICCKSALQAASLNVFINTKLMQDRGFAEKVNARAEELLGMYVAKADAIFDEVMSRVH